MSSPPAPRAATPKRDSVRLRRKAVELSIPCITAVDTANALVNCLRSDHSMKDIPLVDIATLYHKKIIPLYYFVRKNIPLCAAPPYEGLHLLYSSTQNLPKDVTFGRSRRI